VRIAKKRVRVPVLVTLGVCADGCRVVLDLRLAGVESEQAWLDSVRSLAARNLGDGVMAVIDGNPGGCGFGCEWSDAEEGGRWVRRKLSREFRGVSLKGGASIGKVKQ
jgi:hypothetical protein